MPNALSFWPSLSQGQGAEVDRTVRRALAGSLKTVYVQVADRVDCDHDRVQGLLRQIERGPVRPAVFGLYADLVESLHSGRIATLATLSQCLLEVDPKAEGTRILSLSDQDLGAGQAERYARLVDDDPDIRNVIAPLGGEYEEAQSSVSSALTLLDDGAPELAREIRGLVREIVLVTDGGAQPESRSFEGASTFYLWGAVILNVGDAARLDLAQSIAHEGAHLLLFGLMMGQPLTENGLEERFASPLRQDPRPMEGVVHAAYVLSRMSYALEHFLESGVLSLEEQEKARQELVTYRRQFFDTLPIITRHARFRSGADNLFQGAIAYMSREQAQVSA